MSPPFGHIILAPNQPVVTTYKYDARLAEKQRLPILKVFGMTQPGLFEEVLCMLLANISNELL